VSIYRTVQLTFWTDRKIEDEFTAQDKYFYLFLLTNPYTNLCGCYEIGMKQMMHYTGYNENEISNLMSRMSNLYRVCKYSEDTKEVLLLNWHKYNWTKSEKVLVGAYKQAKTIKNKGFQSYVMQLLNEYGYTVESEYLKFEYPMDTTVTVTVNNISTNSNNISKEQDNKDSTVYKTKAVKRGKNKEYTQEFEMFWTAYPRKEGKGEAFKSFLKATDDCGATVQDLLDGIDKYKQTEQWQRDGGKYIPHPTTWLNQKRWEDTPMVTQQNIRQSSTFKSRTNPMDAIRQKILEEERAKGAIV
jgi:hypothetical protein